MIKRTIVSTLLAFALLAPAASAAPLSPSTQFAFNIAANYWGGTGCESVDAQIIPAFPSKSVVATSSHFGERPCFIYLSRELAGSHSFAKACELLINILGVFHGHPFPEVLHLPHTCLTHNIFLLNHPHYLDRRFR